MAKANSTGRSRGWPEADSGEATRDPRRNDVPLDLGDRDLAAIQAAATGSPSVTVNGGPLAFTAPLLSRRK